MKFAGREEILGAIRYRDVECPEAGIVQVLDYISAGAMGEFAANRSNPKAALSAVIRESLKDPDTSFAKLTSNDYDAIARHLVRTTGVVEQFDAKLQKASLPEAFVGAIEESNDWRSHVESEKKFRSSMEKWMRPYNSVFREIERHRFAFLEVTRHAEMLRQFETRTVASLRTPLVELESFQSIASSSVRMAREIEKIHQNARVNLERWNVHTDQFASRAGLVSSLTARHNELTRMVDRLNVIQPLVTPITNLTASFADIASQLRVARPLSEALLSMADSSLAESKLLTAKTSDFFAARERLFAFPAFEPSLPPQVLEHEEEIHSAYEEGETILHEETALIVAEGSSLAENIRQNIGDAIDQRLSKYQNILYRLEKLSKPRVFLDFLNEFSVITARDYWATLWTDPGNTWQSRPERHAQAMLGMFLHGQWSDVAFVGREIANGDGFVDLLVNFMARDYIVELKMIGAGWPVSHAESGLPQLEQYMANYQSQEAYLVVFDGRKTNRGRQLPKAHDTEHGMIHVVVVPAYFDAPSTH